MQIIWHLESNINVKQTPLMFCPLGQKQILLESLLQEVFINQFQDKLFGSAKISGLRLLFKPEEVLWFFAYLNRKQEINIVLDILEKAYVIDSCFCRAGLMSTTDQANFAWFTSTRSVYQPANSWDKLFWSPKMSGMILLSLSFIQTWRGFLILWLLK